MRCQGYFLKIALGTRMGHNEFKWRLLSVFVSWLFQKYLKFKWKDKFYCFTCFSNGLGSCPGIFTKLNKVPLTTWNFENIPLSGYDFFLKEILFQYVKKTYTKQWVFYDKLGFAINFKKSQIVPTQRIWILGFVIDSVKMIATLTQGKGQELKTLVLNLLRINKPTIKVFQLQYLDVSFVFIWKWQSNLP